MDAKAVIALYGEIVPPTNPLRALAKVRAPESAFGHRHTVRRRYLYLSREEFAGAARSPAYVAVGLSADFAGTWENRRSAITRPSQFSVTILALIQHAHSATRRRAVVVWAASNSNNLGACFAACCFGPSKAQLESDLLARYCNCLIRFPADAVQYPELDQICPLVKPPFCESRGIRTISSRSRTPPSAWHLRENRSRRRLLVLSRRRGPAADRPHRDSAHWRQDGGIASTQVGVCAFV